MANIGIDLGTTHSLVSVVLSGKARVLLDDNENPLFPSVLQYDGNGDLTALGTDALEQTGKDGVQTFRSIKRFMGRSPSDVREEATDFGYTLADDERVTVLRCRQGDHANEMSSAYFKSASLCIEECLFQHQRVL